jgi:hypothetical protein
MGRFTELDGAEFEMAMLKQDASKDYEAERNQFARLAA